MEKSMSTTSYRCTLCTLNFPFDKMKYSQDGKRLICMDCYNRILKKGQKDEEERQKKESIASAQSSGEGVGVMCVNCNYKFRYRLNPHNPQVKPKCPYCGKTSLRKYEELTAEKLLNESEKLDFERSKRNPY